MPRADTSCQRTRRHRHDIFSGRQEFSEGSKDRATFAQQVMSIDNRPISGWRRRAVNMCLLQTPMKQLYCILSTRALTHTIYWFAAGYHTTIIPTAHQDTKQNTKTRSQSISEPGHDLESSERDPCFHVLPPLAPSRTSNLTVIGMR